MPKLRLVKMQLEEEKMEQINNDVLRVEAVRMHDDIPLPQYQSEGAAGMDLYAVVDSEVMLHGHGGTAVIPIGIKVAIPKGYEMQIRPRSGLAARYGVTVVNSPGTIDADFRGEVGVILINHGQNAFMVKRGDRIAQAVFSKVEQANLVEVEELKPTARGAGGFGSTGI